MTERGQFVRQERAEYLAAHPDFKPHPMPPGDYSRQTPLAHLRYLAVNSQAARLLGCRAEELVGRPVQERMALEAHRRLTRLLVGKPRGGPACGRDLFPTKKPETAILLAWAQAAGRRDR